MLCLRCKVGNQKMIGLRISGKFARTNPLTGELTTMHVYLGHAEAKICFLLNVIVYTVAQKILNSFRCFGNRSFAILYDFFLFPYLLQFRL